MPAERSGYEARQAALLAALIAGSGFPPGFAPEHAHAASRALTAKRGRAVGVAWPALSHELGDAFAERFDAYARGGAGPPAVGGAVADGLAFAGTIEDPPSDAVRVEIAFARALIALRRGDPVLRRGPFLAAVRLHAPHRVLVVLRRPGGDPRHFAVPLGRR